MALIEVLQSLDEKYPKLHLMERYQDFRCFCRKEDADFLIQRHIHLLDNASVFEEFTSGYMKNDSGHGYFWVQRFSESDKPEPAYRSKSGHWSFIGHDPNSYTKLVRKTGYTHPHKVLGAI